LPTTKLHCVKEVTVHQALIHLLNVSVAIAESTLHNKRLMHSAVLSTVLSSVQ